KGLQVVPITYEDLAADKFAVVLKTLTALNAPPDKIAKHFEVSIDKAFRLDSGTKYETLIQFWHNYRDLLVEISKRRNSITPDEVIDVLEAKYGVSAQL